MSYWVEKEEKQEHLVRGGGESVLYLKTEEEVRQEFIKGFGAISIFDGAYRRIFPSWKETAEFSWEFKRQIDSIDPELSQLIFDWGPSVSSLLTFLTSIGAYPSRKKIEQLKSVLRSPDKHSNDACRTITRILLGRVPYTIVRFRHVRSDGPIFVAGMPAPEKLGEYEQEATNDPDDPDAPMLSPSLVSAELERRELWKRKWEEYLVFLKGRYSNLFTYELKFDSDLPTNRYGNIRISPRLRLPSGEYLEPVVRANTVSPVGPTPSVANETTVSVSEEKKDEKKAFPWWLVIVIVVITLFFFTTGRR
jgi:hypothetical protein